MNVQDYLTEHQIPFEVLRHAETDDAERLADQLRISRREVAKTVLLRADRGYEYILAIVPADTQLDFAQASAALGGSQLELATTEELVEHLPDCQHGALPPFGTEYKLRTLVDASLAEHESIVFEGNTLDEAIRVKWADFQRLENPLVVPLADLASRERSHA